MILIEDNRLTLDQVSKILIGYGYTTSYGAMSSLYVYGENKDNSLVAINTDYCTEYKDQAIVIPSHYNYHNIENFRDKVSALIKVLQSNFIHDYATTDNATLRLRLLAIKDY